jgi:hypothetical protein
VLSGYFITDTALLAYLKFPRLTLHEEWLRRYTENKLREIWSDHSNALSLAHWANPSPDTNWAAVW